MGIPFVEKSIANGIFIAVVVAGRLMLLLLLLLANNIKHLLMVI